MKHFTIILCLVFTNIKAQKIRLDSIYTKQINIENKKVISYGIKQKYSPKKHRLEIIKFNNSGSFDSEKKIQYFDKNNTIIEQEEYYRYSNEKKWRKVYKTEYFLDKNNKEISINYIEEKNKWKKSKKIERFKDFERYYSINYVYFDDENWKKTDQEYYIENDKGKIIQYVSTSVDSLDTEYRQMIKKESFYENDTILKKEILMAFDGYKWVNNQKTEYFVKNKNDYSIILYVFANNEWINHSKTIQTENQKENKTSLLYQIWNKKEEKWEDVSLSEQKIDHNNHSTTIKLYKVNEKSKKMELNETQVYFYDQKGHTIESQFIYNDGRGLRYVYTFDDLGNTQKETQYTYDPNEQTWEEINLYKYTYNTNFLKKDVEDKGNIETESIICENPLLNIRHYTKTGDSYALIRETNYFYTEIKK